MKKNGIKRILLSVFAVIFAVCLTVFGLNLNIRANAADVDYSKAENWFGLHSGVQCEKVSDNSFDFTYGTTQNVLWFDSNAFSYLINEGYDAIRIEYRLTAFCDGKNGAESDVGTNYLNAAYHSAANALDEQEIVEAKARESEDTILRVKIEAVNTGKTSAEAYLRLPQINTPVMAEADAVNEKIENGFGFYGEKVYMRASVNGEKASGAEVAFLIPPKEKVSVNVILFHSPADLKDVENLSENDFDSALKKAEMFWRKTLGDVYFWKLPEKRVEEVLKTGCFHLMESCFGEKNSETFAPCVGVYPPIGSESSPVVRFLTDCGKTDLAGKCMNFFFEREKENGFIQNIRGYMLENGATLYNEGVYFASSGNREQLVRNFGKIKKATEYVLLWIDRNKNEKTCGYGMIDGQVADPEDTYRSYALNAFAYAGLKSAAFLYSACGENGDEIDVRAEELKENIRHSFRESMKKAPLIPLKNGTWVPAVAPWAEGRGASFLHLDGASCFSHAGHILKDSLLGLHFLVWFGVLDRDSEEGRMIVDTMADVYCYGFYMRGGKFRVAKISGDDFVESSPRTEYGNITVSKLKSGATIGMSLSATSETVMTVTVYVDGAENFSCDFTRAAGEIPSSEAYMSVAINTSSVTSLVITGNANAVSAFSSDVTLDSDSPRATGENVVGYDGTIGEVNISGAVSNNSGGVYLFVGSYGFYIRGGAFRVAEIKNGSYAEKSPRTEAGTFANYRFTSACKIGIKFETGSDDNKLLASVYVDGKLSFTYEFTRVTDEISSAEAKMTIEINASEVTSLDIKGV